MLFTVISSIVLALSYHIVLQEMGATYLDTYIIVFFGIAVVGWITGGAPKIKYGFLIVSLLFLVAFSFWSARHPSFPYSWSRYDKNQSIVKYHQRYHEKQTSPPSGSSGHSSTSTGYSTGSSYGGRSYSGGGFSGGK